MSKKNREKKAKQYGAGEHKVTPANELTRFYWVLGAVAVVGIGIVGWSVGSKALSPTVSEPIKMEGIEDPAKLMQVARGVTKGRADAPITIIEFADFQCPGCGSFYRDVEPLVDQEFIESGKAKFIFYDFPLVAIHNHAFLAARAGHCAEDQDKFWPYHDVLYRNQARWAAMQNPTSLFEGYAKDVGLNGDQFSSCLKSDKHADVVTANMQLGFQMQIQGTPTLMVTAGGGSGRRVAATIEGIREGVVATQTGG